MVIFPSLTSPTFNKKVPPLLGNLIPLELGFLTTSYSALETFPNL